MAVGEQFPMFRLATLLARQMSSPVAARIKRYAVSSPRFGAAVCRRVARAYHAGEWCARTLALRLAGTPLPAAARAPPLPASRAMDLGSHLLGEVIIFILGSLIIIFEVNRQATNKEIKKLNKKSQWVAIALSLQELRRELQLQQQELDQLQAALLALQGPAGPDLPAGPPPPAGLAAPDPLHEHFTTGFPPTVM